MDLEKRSFYTMRIEGNQPKLSCRKPKQHMQTNYACVKGLLRIVLLARGFTDSNTGYYLLNTQQGNVGGRQRFNKIQYKPHLKQQCRSESEEPQLDLVIEIQ